VAEILAEFLRGVLHGVENFTREFLFAPSSSQQAPKPHNGVAERLTYILRPREWTASLSVFEKLRAIRL